MLPIKRISYQRVHNLGNYESERLEAEIDLDPSDDAQQVYDDLRLWVTEQLGVTSIRILAERELADLNMKLNDARDRYKRAKAAGVA